MRHDMRSRGDVPDWEPVDMVDPAPPAVPFPQKRSAQLVEAPAIDLVSSDVARWAGIDPPEVAFTIRVWNWKNLSRQHIAAAA